MATFRLAVQPISRGKGHSAVSAAAYRSGTKLENERAGKVDDYTTRAPSVAFSGIFAPANAPEWAHDREQLWNRVEAGEKRADARLAREFQLALPHEMTDQQREWLVKDFAREQFARLGLVADVAIHRPDRRGDERNHHAHILVTDRTIGPEGFASHKDRELNSKEQLAAWREEWAKLANRHLERHGIAARIDHRSNADRGLDAEPTKYEGPAVTELTRQGIATDRRQENDEIRLRNAERELRPPPGLWPEIADAPQRIIVPSSGPDLTPPADLWERGSDVPTGAPASIARQLAPDQQRTGPDAPPDLWERDESPEAAPDDERRRVAPQVSFEAPAMDGFDWTDRGGMNAQQKSANHYMLWEQKGGWRQFDGPLDARTVLRPQHPTEGNEAPDHDEANRQHTAEQQKLAASPVATLATETARMGEASPAPVAAPSRSAADETRAQRLAAFDRVSVNQKQDRDHDHEQDGGRELDR